jgi:hypothetical protein
MRNNNLAKLLVAVAVLRRNPDGNDDAAEQIASWSKAIAGRSVVVMAVTLSTVPKRRGRLDRPNGLRSSKGVKG